MPTQGGAIAIVGAGGSGKTRAVASLAVSIARDTGLPVAVARLGSPSRRDELAELVGGHDVEVIPFMRTNATVRAVQAARARGIVIIDTPSSAPGDETAIDVLGETLGAFQLDGVYLTVPATFTPRAAARLTEGFAPLHIDGLIATHVDAVEQVGIPAELALRTRIPLSHVHSGAGRAASIRTANPQWLAGELTT
jgi:flagellar biosynthesis GTPase FlhF